MNLGIGISLTNYRSVPTVALDPDAAIAALFQTGTPGVYYEGAWYDPSDSTTVFQDAEGTTPAGVGDPVGLILDKSKGLELGAEEVTNGTFDDANGWLNVATTTDNRWYVENGRLTKGPYSAVATQSANTIVAGKTYKIQIDVIAIPLGNIVVSVGDASYTLPLTTGTKTFYLTPTDASLGIRISAGGAGGNGVILDNFSVKELPGNHATQTTSAARPVLQSSGGLYYLDFDGVDDYLSAGDVNGLDGLNAATFGFGAVSTSDTSQRVVTAKWNGPFGFLIDSASTLQRGFFGSSSYSSATKPGDNAAHVSLWEFDTDAYLRVDGSAITLTNPAAPVSPSKINSEPFLVGAKSDNGTVAGYFLGPIYSIVVIDRRITAGEISDLESYLATKSGVTL